VRRAFPRILSTGLVALTFLPWLQGCSQRPAPPPPEALVDTWVAMWNSYDLDQVRELFLTDGRLTYFSSEREGVIHGMEELLDHHQGFGFEAGGAPRSARLWVEDLETTRFDDMAVLTGIWFFQQGAEESDLPQRGPVTFVCVLQEGRWWFVHMNFSTYLPDDSADGSEG